MEDQVIVKILKEGDQVLNVSHIGKEIHIAIRKKSEEVLVYSVSLDENGLPKLAKTPKITITYGDDQIEAWATDPNGQQVFSLTA